MSDFFARLVSRVHGATPLVVPRLPSFYAPLGAADAPLDTARLGMEEEVELPPRPPRGPRFQAGSQASQGPQATPNAPSPRNHLSPDFRGEGPMEKGHLEARAEGSPRPAPRNAPDTPAAP